VEITGRHRNLGCRIIFVIRIGNSTAREGKKPRYGKK
jgi:hypothetical protein